MNILKESMRYDQLRDLVAERKPGWEHLQKALISLDPVRARDDPVIVKNVPYYKAKKALEVEVLNLDVPSRPQNWGEIDLPLKASSWTEEELKDPAKVLEMTSLLTAQREIADKILDAQWEAKWRQDKVCFNPGLPLFNDIVLHLFWLPSIQDREVTSGL
ncbi:hypothetical protein BHE74_00041680 [Ensete ventricosum]|nr:hypothetical protein BHE74_00041680 [Ensete ventricosum]